MAWKDGELTARIKVDQTKHAFLVVRDECHLPIMDQEIGRVYRDGLQVFADDRELVRLVLIKLATAQGGEPLS